MRGWSAGCLRSLTSVVKVGPVTKRCERTGERPKNQDSRDRKLKKTSLNNLGPDVKVTLEVMSIVDVVLT